jgi:para-nitrobenzyl esterase
VEGSLQWRGVPFAAPPIGGRRFRPPEPPLAWEGIRDATAFGHTAAQPMSALQALEGGTPEDGSEDCLYLNVFAPVAAIAPGAPPKPVMVWIHGGAFVAGSGSSRWYDGARFAATGDVVVVTFNYRLGALGFLELGAVAGPDYRSAGNCGLLDQLAALRWVQENIAAFGGDPSQVTVFGESAGAMSIGTMLAMPAARGLFQRAILQSGAMSSYRTREDAEAVTDAILKAFGGGFEELATAPVEQILAAQTAVTRGSLTTSYLDFRPVVDGVDIPEPPDRSGPLRCGFEGPVLIGTNKDEMSLFLAFDPAVAMLGEEQLEAQAATMLGADRWARLGEYYRQAYQGQGAKARLYAAATDLVFRIPALQVAEQLAAADRNVWMYRFDWPTPFGGGFLGATHALDIPFVWSMLDLPGVEMFTGDAPARYPLSEVMHASWVAFATTGDPSTPRLAWPRYRAPERASMLFDAESRVAPDPDGAEREVWGATF